ncbi:PspC domain-containing protein [Methylocaldum sp.]|uniref:PspC domain-containing protein n=1 Tax=Methylocaldum sp. TaxID=1969727 RepID=UPI002D32A627|nr:PspC domain-containing protein [Methylocaldum sp.]HYE37956.1 PspC domain-containing protein [Methylocaldum sp.]
MSSRRKLQRNRQRRRLGGVCAGIADYFDVDVTVVRFLFTLSVFFSFSLTMWIYLALWALLPAGTETPMPEVSWRLYRELKRIEKLVRKAHRRLPASVADEVQETFDAIKILAPYLERLSTTPNTTDSLREQALLRFPAVVRQMLSFPANLPPFKRLLVELAELKDEIQRASNELIDQEIHRTLGDADAVSPQVKIWKERLSPLRETLRERAGGNTLLMLQQIEEKLTFLMERIDSGNDVFDLAPFEVRKIAFDYLPDTVNQYLQLPPSMARSQQLSSGKTAEESLNDQLNLLDRALHDLAKSLFEKDAQGLLVHGRFLKEKFAEQSFRLSD